MIPADVLKKVVEDIKNMPSEELSARLKKYELSEETIRSYAFLEKMLFDEFGNAGKGVL